MASYKNYVAGRMNSSIQDLLETNLNYLSSKDARYVLVTCLDTTTDVASLARSDQVIGLFHDAEPVGGGLILPTKQLIEVIKDGTVFHG